MIKNSLFLKQMRNRLVKNFIYRMQGIIELKHRDWSFRRHRAVLTIQRLIRGCIGRRKVSRKREMNCSIEVLTKLVSVDNFPVYLLEKLADEIRSFQSNSARIPPSGLISLIRCIHCLLYGDSSQQISYFRFENLTSMNLYASELGWLGAERVLRRKSTFIRKLRGLVNRLSPPNMLKLEPSLHCLHLLDEIAKNITADDFEGLSDGRITALKLLEYVWHIRQVLVAQTEFPEIFDSALPKWTIGFRRRRRALEMSCARLLYSQKCIDFLSKWREERLKEGIHFGIYTEAIQRQREEIITLSVIRSKAEKSFNTSCDELIASRRRKGETIEHKVRANLLAFEISNQLHSEYMSSAKVIVEAKERQLRDTTLQAKLNFLQSESMASISRQLLAEEDQYILNKKYACYGMLSDDSPTSQSGSPIQSYVEQLGEVIAELVVLSFEWKSFVLDLGGIQFIDNANEVEIREYNRMKTRSRYLLNQRKKLSDDLDHAIEFDVDAKAEEFRLKVEGILRSHQWDSCTSQELHFEIEEDIACAKDELKFARRSDSGDDLNIVHLPREGGKHEYPLLLVADAKISKNDKDLLLNSLKDLPIKLIETSPTDPSCDNFDLSKVSENFVEPCSFGIIFLDISRIRKSLGKLCSSLCVFSSLETATKIVLINYSETLESRSKYRFPLPSCSPNIVRLQNQLAILSNVVDNGDFTKVLLSELQSALTLEIPNVYVELAALVSAVLGLWSPPFADWSPEDIIRESSKLASRFPSGIDLYYEMFRSDLRYWDMVSYNRLLPALNLQCLDISSKNSKTSCLYWVTAWVAKAMELVDT